MIKDFLREYNWTKFHGAVDKNGIHVHPASEEACRWCLVGAICYFYGDTMSPIIAKVATYINQHYPTVLTVGGIGAITEFNDYHAKWRDIERIIKELEL